MVISKAEILTTQIEEVWHTDNKGYDYNRIPRAFIQNYQSGNKVVSRAFIQSYSTGHKEYKTLLMYRSFQAFEATVGCMYRQGR